MKIFDHIKAVDMLDVNAIDDAEFLKSFSPYMMLKWYAATNDSKRVQLVNEIVNPMIFHLHKEKKLLYYLLCCCSEGKEKRYSWINRPKKTNKHLLEMVCNFYDISAREAEGVIKKLSKDDLLEILDYMGYDKKLSNTIKKNL